MYAPSDYDLRHQINGYWVAELPFGRGKDFGGNVSKGLDAVIGGWQLGGTARDLGIPLQCIYEWPRFPH